MRNITDKFTLRLTLVEMLAEKRKDMPVATIILTAKLLVSYILGEADLPEYDNKLGDALKFLNDMADNALEDDDDNDERFDFLS